MWLDYVKQKEEGKGLENFQEGGGGGRGVWGGVMGVWSRKNRGKPKCKTAGTSNKQKLHWLCKQTLKSIQTELSHSKLNYTENITTNHTSLCPCKRPRRQNSGDVLRKNWKSYGQESLQPLHSNGRLQCQNWSKKYKWKYDMHRTLWNRQQNLERGKTPGFCRRKQPGSNKFTLLKGSKQILDMESSRGCDWKSNWLHIFRPEDCGKLWGHNQSGYW